MMDTTFYMACLKLRDRPALVIGGGEIGQEKIEGLLAAGARVTVVAPRVSDDVATLAREEAITWHRREFLDTDLDGQLIAIAATDDTDLNVRIWELAEGRAMLVNVVDVPPLCNFILPAVVRQGPIAVAISTAGASPALAKRMKREIAELMGEEYGRLAEILNEQRGWAKRTLPTYHDRKDFFEAIVNGEPDPIALLRSGKEAELDTVIAERRDQAVAGLATRA